MIYDKLAVALLSMLSTEQQGTTNATIARYLVEHGAELPDATVKGIAAARNGHGAVKSLQEYHASIEEV